MRLPLLCMLIAVPAFAADFTLESESGEMSRDASHSKSTYLVAGTSMTVTTESRGRNTNPGGEADPAPKTVTLSNPQEVATALAAIRATANDKKSPRMIDTRYRTACLIEGKVKRCSTVTEGTSARLEAIGKLEQLLLAELWK
jgi:hypothetical protein